MSATRMISGLVLKERKDIFLGLPEATRCDDQPQTKFL